MKNIYVELTPEIEEEIGKLKEKISYQSDEELYRQLILIGLDKVKEKEGGCYGVSNVRKMDW